MRVCVLTTETTHHAYFVRELAGAYPALIALVETTGVVPPFATHHPFEDEREELERRRFFGAGAVPALSDLAPTVHFETINDVGVPAALVTLAPDAIIVFGTRIIRPHVLAATRPGATLNLHGGDPERYRGLDTHLWAIHGGDFSGLVTVLHHVEPEVDAGAIVGRVELPVPIGMSLAELRAVNTEACVALALDVLERLDLGAQVIGTPQRRVGHSYSFMPAELKESCVRRFARAGAGA